MERVTEFTIGVDLGDKQNIVCVLDGSGEVYSFFKVTNTKKAMRQCFKKYSGALVAIEAGTHSAWIDRLLKELGCEVLVGNPRKLGFIWNKPIKTDFRDAEALARVARMDPRLLSAIVHRSADSQASRAILQARDAMVKNRTSLINHVRGTVKSMGERVPNCSAASFHKQSGYIPNALKSALIPVIQQIESLSEQIKKYDREIEEISRTYYPETEILRQVPGVGAITALSFVLTLEDKNRFSKSRDVGAFLGLVPRRDQSGEIDKQLRITKCGDTPTRRLLVSSAQYILGPFGPDSELRRHGERIAQRGGKIAKKRAVVAVARKLSVLLHRLWVTGEEYAPFYCSKKSATKVA